MRLRNPRTSVAERAAAAASPLRSGQKSEQITTSDVEGGSFDDHDDNIMLGFQNLSMSSVDPPKHIVDNVTGYVIQGGITAILGPSGGGKSVLMKVLTGRLPTVQCTGEVTFCGKPIDPQKKTNGFGFVSQEDSLIGDLTVRETFKFAASLRNARTLAQADEDADEVIQRLGLGKVCDNVVGTILKRGLSGGEKRRTSVGQELVVRQALAFLDEPTSGLDGTAAYDVIKVLDLTPNLLWMQNAQNSAPMQTIKDFTRRSEGDFSVMLSIHQPNRRILDLFDHILLLGRGGSLFFGTLPEAIEHFENIGHPTPAEQVPTDFFMKVTDDSFALPTVGQTNFTQVFASSDICASTIHKLEVSKTVMLAKTAKGREDHTFDRPGFYRQLSTLLLRDVMVAIRDPTLYYLQLVLHMLYGFLVGSTFWNTPTVIDNRQNELTAACVWMIMLQSYIHVFKVFFLVNTNRRFASERPNLSHGVISFFTTETLVTAVAQLLWVPGGTIAFFMVGLPAKAYLFSMFSLYVAALSAEGMINFTTHLTNNTSIAIVVSQACLVILTVFAGGIFRPFDEIPAYWEWVQALSFFTHSSKAFLLGVYEHVTFVCPAGSILHDFVDGITVNGYCVTLEDTFDCDVAFDTDSFLCEVAGTTVIDINAGGLTGDKWQFLGNNLLLLAGFRAGVLFFIWWPKSSIIHAIKTKLASPLVKVSLAQQTEIHLLWGEVAKLKTTAQKNPLKMLGAITVHPIQNPVDDATGTAANTAEFEMVTPIGDLTSAPAPAAPADEAGAGAIIIDEMTRVDDGEGAGLAPPTSDKSTHKALVFQNVELTLPEKGKVLIDKVTGKATAGRVLALMGPSGAGKTTLLNALSGRATYAKMTGLVTLGGRPLASDDLNYVPQYDDLNEMFTSRELLTYMRHLKVLATKEETTKSVVELLQILGLTLKGDLQVSNLSGGEKKRLSIGLGMVSEPEVLFLDEPTTGLDSAGAHSVVGYISKLAAKTKVVCIMTIHQPAEELFDLLEDLMLLERGRLAYFGTTKHARMFFDSLGGACPSAVNPADYYLDLISQPPAATVAPEGVTWKELYNQSVYDVPIVTVSFPVGDGSVDHANHRPNWRSRGRTLVNNMFVYYWRTLEIHWLRMAELVVLALFVGTMFFRLDNTEIAETASASFFNIWCVLFVVVASVPAFCRDRRTTLQEILNGAYGPGMYCVAQFLASAPFIFLSAIIYQSIFHWLVGFNDSAEAYTFAVLLSATLLFMMEALMLMVVQTLKNAMLACTFGIVVLGMLFLFTGFFIKPADMVWPVQWITYVMPTRYAFDGYLHSIFHGQTYSTTFNDVSGDLILQTEFAQAAGESHWLDLGVVVGWVMCLRTAHFVMVYYGILPYRNAMAVPKET